jgi:hypothetical protein
MPEEKNEPREAVPLRCCCGQTINVRDAKGEWVMCSHPIGRRCEFLPKR